MCGYLWLRRLPSVTMSTSWCGKIPCSKFTKQPAIVIKICHKEILLLPEGFRCSIYVIGNCLCQAHIINRRKEYISSVPHIWQNPTFRCSIHTVWESGKTQLFGVRFKYGLIISDMIKVVPCSEILHLSTTRIHNRPSCRHGDAGAIADGQEAAGCAYRG